MAKRNQYAHELLNAFNEHRDKVKASSGPYPIDIGEVTAVGEDDSDILIKMMNASVTWVGDEVQFLIDEEWLSVGDIVAVAYDKGGDPIVLAADFQRDPYVTATGPVTGLNPTSLHEHHTKVFVPTAPQTSFQVPHDFSGESVYVDGSRKAPTYGYEVDGRRVVLTVPTLASSIVQIDYQVDL